MAIVNQERVGKKPVADWDVAALLQLMRDAWTDLFGPPSGSDRRITLWLD